MHKELIRPDGSRPRILFAEDSDTVRLVTAALLRRMGCDVDAVEHGEEAVLRARRHNYDLVLLDIEMPVMDGMIAARAIRALGPKTVIVKRGDSGALLFHEHGVFAAPAYPLEEVVDPTGAGDTFAGGFMGYLARVRDLSPQAVRRAMFYGSVMASFCVEAFSLDRLRDLSAGEIEGRYRAFRDLTHFEDVRL